MSRSTVLVLTATSSFVSWNFYRCTCMVGITRILGTAFLPTEFFPREPKHQPLTAVLSKLIITLALSLCSWAAMKKLTLALKRTPRIQGTTATSLPIPLAIGGIPSCSAAPAWRGTTNTRSQNPLASSPRAEMGRVCHPCRPLTVSGAAVCCLVLISTFSHEDHYDNQKSIGGIRCWGVGFGQRRCFIQQGAVARKLTRPFARDSERCV